jgi:DNA polymerase III delta prime subunit
MNKYDSLWVEKYRPKKLSDLISSEENLNFFREIKNDTPHLLFFGPAGTGKTTLAKIIVNDILKCQYLYINASDENGVDTIRNKVISFIQTKSIDGKKKVVILDEFCGTTPEAQRILRNVMEEYSDNSRFILTANYKDRVISPIKSRCVMFTLDLNVLDVLKRCIFILKTENIKVNDLEKTKLIKFIDYNCPDLRRIINDLQKFSITGELIISENQFLKEFSNDIFTSLISKQNSIDIRKKVIESEKKFNSDYQNLLKEIFDIFYDSNLPDIKKKNILVDMGEYLYRDNLVLDKEINFFCCILSLEKILNY